MSLPAEFGTQYPLPFRILFLAFATLLGYATNLHLLAYLGIDTALVLDRRVHARAPPGGANPLVHPSTLYGPLYSLAAGGLVWSTLGWLSWRSLVQGAAGQSVGEDWRSVPTLTVLAVAIALVVPANVLCRRERYMFLRSVHCKLGELQRQSRLLTLTF